MKIYTLTLKQKSGLLTELQSDTIYGHFCWRLKENLGDKKLEEFIEYYRNGKPIFTLSDGLLKLKEKIKFPRPFIFQKAEMKDDKIDKVISFVNNKRLKEKKSVEIDELNNFLSSGKVEMRIEDDLDNGKKKTKKKKNFVEESLRVSVQIDRSTYGSMEGRLFSYKPRFSGKGVSFVILIKVIDEEKFINDFNCEQLLKDTFTIGYGKKKSSGYGQFEVIDFQEYNEIKEPQNANAFIVLGNYLPSKLDSIEPIGYDINTKYGKFGEQLSLSENPFKNPIVFLTAGSCFMTNNIKDFYGRITDEKEISELNNFAVQFGMPFTLNFNLVS